MLARAEGFHGQWKNIRLVLSAQALELLSLNPGGKRKKKVNKGGMEIVSKERESCQAPFAS